MKPAKNDGKRYWLRESDHVRREHFLAVDELERDWDSGRPPVGKPRSPHPVAWVADFYSNLRISQ